MNNPRKKYTTKKYKLLLLLSCQKQCSKLSVVAVVENIVVIRVVMWREKGVIESKTLKQWIIYNCQTLSYWRWDWACWNEHTRQRLVGVLQTILSEFRLKVGLSNNTVRADFAQSEWERTWELFVGGFHGNGVRRTNEEQWWRSRKCTDWRREKMKWVREVAHDRVWWWVRNKVVRSL